MRVAIVSDTHSRENTIRKALRMIDPYKVEMILHCGDIEDADVVPLFPPITHFVFGNCDTDRLGIHQAVDDCGATMHESFGHVSIGGLELGFIHGDGATALRELIASEAFHFVFHGHTHTIRDEQQGPTRIINPGALHRAKVKTFALLDVERKSIEWIDVEG